MPGTLRTWKLRERPLAQWNIDISAHGNSECIMFHECLRNDNMADFKNWRTGRVGVRLTIKIAIWYPSMSCDSESRVRALARVQNGMRNHRVEITPACNRWFLQGVIKWKPRRSEWSEYASIYSRTSPGCSLLIRVCSVHNPDICSLS